MKSLTFWRNLTLLKAKWATFADPMGKDLLVATGGEGGTSICESREISERLKTVTVPAAFRGEEVLEHH